MDFSSMKVTEKQKTTRMSHHIAVSHKYHYYLPQNQPNCHNMDFRPV